MMGKIYICRFKRPIVVERIIYYNPEVVIRNNEILLNHDNYLTILNENNNNRSLIILQISLIYNFNNKIRKRITIFFFWNWILKIRLKRTITIIIQI